MNDGQKLSPTEAKRQQHERYDKIAVLVAQGKLGYIPAKKSRFSKSCGEKWKNYPLVSFD